MSIISALFVHSASVETFKGSGPTGDMYAAPVTVKGFLDDGIVRVQSSIGEQLIQKAIFYTALTNASIFTPESRVTVNGRACQVTSVRRRDGGLFGLPNHAEVDLT